MPARAFIPSRPSMCPLRERADILSGVFSTARPAPGDGAEPIRTLTVRWLSAPDEPLADHFVARVSTPLPDRYRVRAGDLVVPSRSTSIRVSVVPPELDGTVFNSTLLVVRCSDRIIPELLAAYLMHPVGAAHLISASQSGTAQMNLTTAALGEIPVPLVPHAQQVVLANLLAVASDAHRRASEAAFLRHQLAHHLVISSMIGKDPNHA